MIVYKDWINGQEYFSDSDGIKVPTLEDGKAECTGLVMVSSTYIRDPDDEDPEAKVLDYFHGFPSIQPDDEEGNTPGPQYKKFSDFKTEFLKTFVGGLLKVLKDQGKIASKEDSNAVKERLESATNWLKSHWSDITIRHSIQPVANYRDKEGESKEMFASVVFEIYFGEDVTPHFVFFKDAYKEVRC